MKRNYTWPAITVALFAVLTFVALPDSLRPSAFHGIDVHLGLDLAGGTQLDFRISEEEIRNQIAQINQDIENEEDANERTRLILQRDALQVQQQSLVEAIRSVLEKRINALGVSEAIITPSYIGSEKHLLVECPGIIDEQECIDNVGKTINLEFKEEYDGPTEQQEEKMRGIAETINARIASGETLQTVGQDLSNELGVSYQETRTYFRDQLPEALAGVWDTSEIGLQVIEGSIPSFSRDESGQVVPTENKGMFFTEVTGPKTQTGRAINSPIEALEHLSSVRNGTFKQYEDQVIDDSIHETLRNALSTMAQSDLRAVGDTNNTDIIFLQNYTAGRTEVDASHILIAYQGASRANSDVTRTKEEALALAQDLKKQIDEGADFVTLAKEQSDGPSAVDGGALGTFGRGDGYVVEFENAAFALEKNQVSEPTETEFGYHLIRSNSGPVKTDDRASFATLSLTNVSKQEAEVLINDIRDGNITRQEDVVPMRTLFLSFTPTGWKDTPLDGKHFQTATVTLDHVGIPSVQILFDTEGGKLFQELTRRNVGKQLAIFVGGSLVSAPTVNQEIAGGSAVITGNFSFPEANQLALDLNTGAIPAPIYLVGQRTVEATLGTDALHTSLRAALIGLLILMAYMILIYRLPGFLANLALTAYALIFTAFLKLPLFLVSGDYIVLTLAGMAGIILSIGMAVDANVLIFERMKEELKKGKSIPNAVDAGFLRAWPSIRDGNVSTFITCFILFTIGTSIVKGFAVTLGMGIAISMFSAIVITRWLLKKVARMEFAEKNKRLFY